MMDILKKYKNLLIGTGVVVVLFIGYSFFTDDGSSEVLTSSVTSGEEVAANADLLLLLTELRRIRLHDQIFQDPLFRSLQDFGQELVPEPSGRRNPFAPVGFE